MDKSIAAFQSLEKSLPVQSTESSCTGDMVSGEQSNLWDGYELREFVDHTGRPYVAPVDKRYGTPLALETLAWKAQVKLGEYPGTLDTLQKAIITNALLQWRLAKRDPHELAREAMNVMPRKPGQWPLTLKCVVQWDNLRRREWFKKGKHWPFKTAEEFLASELCGDIHTWNAYTRLDELAGITPPLGLGGSNGTPIARRIMTYSDREREKDLRYFERDPLIYAPGKPTGTIRDRMWFEVVKMAKTVLRYHTEHIDPARLQLARAKMRGAVIAYAVFVDCYSYMDTPDEVIKLMEKEAIKSAKSLRTSD